jgi:hypothetical protein
MVRLRHSQRHLGEVFFAREAALVPQGAEMEDGVRGPDQRAQTTVRSQPQPLSGRGRDGTVGRIRGGRRHAYQYGKSFGKPEERIKPYCDWGEEEQKNFPRCDGKAGAALIHTRARPLIYPPQLWDRTKRHFCAEN